LRVLATYLYGAAHGFVAFEYVNPVAAGGLVEGAAGDDDALRGLSQLQVNVVGLSGADIVGAGAGEG